MTPQETGRTRLFATVRLAAPIFFSAFVLLTTGCSGGASTDLTGSLDSGPPTVVLVTIDTLRADRIGALGRENAGTTTLDALAEDGVLFTSAQTTAPLTLPAHTSIMSGRTLPAHGVLNNGTYAAPEQVPLLAERFKANGYKTGAFISSLVLAERYGLARGFDRYDDEIERRPINVGGKVVHYEEREGSKTVDRAMAWLLGVGDSPAMLWVHVWEPHAPYRPPQDLLEQYAEDRYQGEVVAADRVVQRLLEGVKSLERGPVLTVVVSDHGESLWEHGEETHGIFLYRGVMNVPLIIHGPGMGVARGKIIEQSASVADIAPTIAELMELEPFGGADGLSLADAVTGRGTMPNRDGVFAESWLPTFDFAWSGLRAFVAAEAKYKYIDAPRAEVYDLEADPEEADNLLESGRQPPTNFYAQLESLAERAAQSSPSESATLATTDEDLATLRSLGYAATGIVADTERIVDVDRTDPKDGMEIVAKHDEAVRLMGQGKAEEAVALLEPVIPLDDKNPSLLFQYAEALVLSKRLEDAAEALQKTVEAAPTFGLAWYRLGQVFGGLGDPAKEETAYRQAIRSDPYNLSPRKALASLLAEQSRFSEAEDVVEEARGMDSDDADLSQLLERIRNQAAR